MWRSPDQNERLGGVLAIDELIDVKVRMTTEGVVRVLHWRSHAFVEAVRVASACH